MKGTFHMRLPEGNRLEGWEAASLMLPTRGPVVHFLHVPAHFFFLCLFHSGECGLQPSTAKAGTQTEQKVTVELVESCLWCW